ncbi:MAG: hypothetical protein IKU86_09830 [Thermoguttaceae bacterium]|nr:hypothetical protein [Thermoguttaceae bacterium]
MQTLSRRDFVLRAAACFGASLFVGRAAFGANAALDPATLKQELRVKTDAEAAFVDDVVAKARAGEISVEILTVAYRYAQKKDGGRRVYYFANCLKILTQRAGRNVKFLKF